MTWIALRPPARPLSDGMVELRVWHPDDADQVARTIGSDPEITHWTLMPEPFTIADAEKFIRETPEQWRKGEAALFCINPRGEPERVIGAIGLYVRHPQIGHVGYWVASAERRRGVATRALRLLSRWAFDHARLERLELQIIPGNETSIRVAEAAGYQREGTLRSSIVQRGERRDGIMYSLLPTDAAP